MQGTRKPALLRWRRDIPLQLGTISVIAIYKNSTVPIKVKQSHYRSGQALRVPGVWDSQISRQSEHEVGKIVSPTHRSPLPTQEIFLLEAESTIATLRREGICQWRIPMTLSGNEPAIFRLVAQCLNPLRHRVLPPPPTFPIRFPKYWLGERSKDVLKRAWGISQINIHVLLENVKCANRLVDVGADRRSEFIWTSKVQDVWVSVRFVWLEERKNDELLFVW
jgi:hypothetical protein